MSLFPATRGPKSVGFTGNERRKTWGGGGGEEGWGAQKGFTACIICGNQPQFNLSPPKPFIGMPRNAPPKEHCVTSQKTAAEETTVQPA